MRTVLLILGIAVMAYIFTASSGALEPTPINLIIGGAIAISAMLLPGISGSFMLVLMGLYKPVLAAFNSFDYMILLYFIFGLGAGLLLFTRFTQLAAASLRAGHASAVNWGDDRLIDQDLALERSGNTL